MNTLEDKFRENIKKRGVDIKVNGLDKRALFKEVEDKNSDDTKWMLINLGETKQGDYIDAFNGKWLKISQCDNINGIYEKALVKKCQHNIKFNFTGNVRSFIAAIDTKVMDIDSNQFMS